MPPTRWRAGSGLPRRSNSAGLSFPAVSGLRCSIRCSAVCEIAAVVFGGLDAPCSVFFVTISPSADYT